MITYDSPKHSNTEIFELLYSKRRDKVPDTTFTTLLLQAIKAAEDEYWNECGKGNFDYSSVVSVPPGLNNGEMVALYTNHFAKKESSGRVYYDKIVKGKICCYCGRHMATQADHYKEKAKFPLLSVFPANLLPSCGDCNQALCGVEHKFHGYFDNISSLDWLGAELCWDGDPEEVPDSHFYVKSSFSKDAGLVGRVDCTFEKAGIGTLWACELAPKIDRARKIFLRDGDLKFRESSIQDLKENNESNPFHDALFDAMLKSRWIRELPARK